MMRGSGLVVFGLEVDAGLGALLGRDRRGRGRQRVEAVARLRERDDVADRLGLREVLQHAVHAERDPAVRRGAELERIQQEPELLIGLLVAGGMIGGAIASSALRTAGSTRAADWAIWVFFGSVGVAAVLVLICLQRMVHDMRRRRGPDE